MTLITAEALTLGYDSRAVLRDIDFSISTGEIVTLVGPNGSGKSSLLRALAGALHPLSGRIVRQKTLRIGYVPQKLALDRTLPLTVGRFMTLPERRDAHDVSTALYRVGLPNLAERPLATLSGGQVQRAMLARALMGRPDLLILDEPTQGLDQPGIAAFYRLIADLRTVMGCAVVMASHDLHVVMSATDRVICLNGHICCQGTPKVVTEAPEYRALFGHGTQGTLALYRHQHDHAHHDHVHDA